MYCFLYCYGDHRDLHVLTHSFPTRRSSDLFPPDARGRAGARRRTRPRRLVAAPGRPSQRPGDALHRRGRMTASAAAGIVPPVGEARSEEPTSELQSLMRISYAVFCLKKKKTQNKHEQQKNTSKTRTH